jgi:hypothetical protein
MLLILFGSLFHSFGFVNTILLWCSSLTFGLSISPCSKDGYFSFMLICFVACLIITPVGDSSMIICKIKLYLIYVSSNIKYYNIKSKSVNGISGFKLFNLQYAIFNRLWKQHLDKFLYIKFKPTNLVFISITVIINSVF